jgi:hypothetical protein
VRDGQQTVKQPAQQTAMQALRAEVEVEVDNPLPPTALAYPAAPRARPREGRAGTPPPTGAHPSLRSVTQAMLDSGVIRPPPDPKVAHDGAARARQLQDRQDPDPDVPF